MRRSALLLLSAVLALGLCACAGLRRAELPVATEAPPALPAPQATEDGAYTPQPGYFDLYPDSKPAPVSFNGKTYVYSGELHKPEPEDMTPAASGALTADSAALANAPCYTYSSAIASDALLLKFSQESYLLYLPETEPAEDTPEPTAEAAPQTDQGLSVTVTKSPSDETVAAGGKVKFVAHADNATSIYWMFMPPDGSNVFSAAELLSQFSGLEVGEPAEDTIELKGVPTGLDGWTVQARFSGGKNYADTAAATIHVTA